MAYKNASIETVIVSAINNYTRGSEILYINININPLVLHGEVSGIILAARALPGERSPLILELPPLRLPRAKNLWIKTRMRAKWYLGEAVPLFLVGTLLLFVLDRVGALACLTRAGEPLMVGVLGLPAQAAGVFVMGFLRRDYGAAGLFTLAQNGQLSGVQAVVALTVMTLFVPCVANFLMIVKERGWRTGLAILGVVTPVALLTGAALNYGLRLLGVTF